ncbi:MAG: sigma-70 family RNA polymerase sigma factor [Oscillospiraceae bacterium]|nr:sigma-70 family RNA polymerase sigma factor [Oscillospiraceae bacterium]
MDSGGVRAYFEQVYTETFPVMTRFVSSRCGDFHDAADIVQSVYLSFFQQLSKKGKNIKDVRAYLFKSCRHELSRYRKRQSARPEPDEEIELAPETGADFREMVENAQLLEQLWQEILSLPADISRCFVLFYLHDMTLEQIGRELALPESTVKSRLYRTQRMMREKFLMLNS